MKVIIINYLKKLESKRNNNKNYNTTKHDSKFLKF